MRRVQSSEADLTGASSRSRVGLERDSQVCQTRDQSLAAHNAAQQRTTNNHSKPRLASKCKLYQQDRVGGELQACTRSTLSLSWGWKGNTLKLRPGGEVCGSADVSISSGYPPRLPWTYTNTASHYSNLHIHRKAFQWWQFYTLGRNISWISHISLNVCELLKVFILKVSQKITDIFLFFIEQNVSRISSVLQLIITTTNH